MNFYRSKETGHNLYRKHEQNTTYRMLGIQLLQQCGISSLRKMALFIDERQQPQFLEQQEKAEEELVHRWTQMLSPVWKRSHCLEVVVCKESQNHLYMTKTPISQTEGRFSVHTMTLPLTIYPASKISSDQESPKSLEFV